jgi:putative toxin-antitoxin system antitoxin component (TIGR02293 family)
MTALARRLDDIAGRTAVKEREVAQLLGTTPQTLYRWRNDQAGPTRDHLQRILDLHYVTEELSELYEPDDARIWLFTRHRLLGARRPADVLAEGDIDTVLALIAQLRDGAIA